MIVYTVKLTIVLLNPKLIFSQEDHLKYMYTLFFPGDCWADRYFNERCKAGVFFPRAGGLSGT